MSKERGVTSTARSTSSKAALAVNIFCPIDIGFAKFVAGLAPSAGLSNGESAGALLTSPVSALFQSRLYCPREPWLFPLRVCIGMMSELPGALSLPWDKISYWLSL